MHDGILQNICKNIKSSSSFIIPLGSQKEEEEKKKTLQDYFPLRCLNKLTLNLCKCFTIMLCWMMSLLNVIFFEIYTRRDF